MKFQINNQSDFKSNDDLLGIVRFSYLVSSIAFLLLLVLLVVYGKNFLEAHRGGVYFSYFMIVLVCYTVLDKINLSERHYGWVLFSLAMAPVTLLTLLLVKVICILKQRYN